MLSGSPSTSIQILVDYPPTVCALYQALSPLIGIQSCLFFSCVYYYVYCWFSVSRHSKYIKIKIKTVQLIKSRNWEMKGGTYTKTLAKIQVRGIFRIRDIRRNVLPKFIEICMETPCWCPPGWAPTWRTETNKNICYRVLVQKREFIPRGTHKHQSNTFSNDR